jgi:integrase
MVVDHTKSTAKHAPKEGKRRTVIDSYCGCRHPAPDPHRLREILKLEWQHVDLERGLLLLPDSKTGAKSTILNAPALAVLAGLKPSRSSFQLF